MAKQLFVNNATAIAMATAILNAIDAGTQAVIRIYDNTIPADCDASIGSSVVLAELTCAATSGTVAASGNNGRLTFAAIASDSSADASGTATYFRILTQAAAGTAVIQGTVGVGTFDLALNTVSITAGSTVSITSGTIDVPEG